LKVKKNMPENEEVAKPQDSKCWNCKHGMVLFEQDLQTFVQPGIVPGDPFDGEEDKPGFTQMSVDLSKVRSVCFWRSQAGPIVSPLVFNVVTECSRYEDR
jgi:hypothetical protein